LRLQAWNAAAAAATGGGSVMTYNEGQLREQLRWLCAF
jgi:hypothetical protein